MTKWRCAGCGEEVVDAIQTCECATSAMCPDDGGPSAWMHRRGDFAEALSDFIKDFARDPGISWDEAIHEMEVEISQMRKELARNA